MSSYYWIGGWVICVLGVVLLGLIRHGDTEKQVDDEHECCDGVGGCHCTGKHEVPDGTILYWDEYFEIPVGWRRRPDLDYDGAFAAMKCKEAE